MLTPSLRRLLAVVAGLALLLAACTSSAKAPKPTPFRPSPLPGSPTKDALIAYALRNLPPHWKALHPERPANGNSAISLTSTGPRYAYNSIGFDGVTIGYRTSTGIANGFVCESVAPNMGWGRSAKVFDVCLNAPIPGIEQFRAWYAHQSKIPLPSHPRPETVIVTERSAHHPIWYLSWFSQYPTPFGPIPDTTISIDNTDDKAPEGYSRACFYPNATEYKPC